MPEVLFHLAFPVTDLRAAKGFYVMGLGCALGRESETALILNLGGHQIVAHLAAPPTDQEGIYPRHFGLIFTSHAGWKAVHDRAKAGGLLFYQEARLRFPGTRLSHESFFLKDPSGNLLEFKHYHHPSAIFEEHATPNIGDIPSARRDRGV